MDTPNRPFLSLISLLGFLLSFTSCLHNAGTEPPRKTTGSAQISLRLDKPGILAKTSALQLEKVVLVLTASNETPRVDTLSVATGNGAATLSRTYGNLTALVKEWRLEVASLDANDSVVHRGFTHFVVLENDTLEVNLAIEPRFSTLRASIFPVRDSVTGARISVDGVVAVDSNFSKGALAGDTLDLEFDYLTSSPQGQAHQILIVVYGDHDGVRTLLYQGSTSLSAVSGSDGNYEIRMEYVGPFIPGTGSVDLLIELVRVGQIRIQGGLRDPSFILFDKNLDVGLSDRANDLALTADGGYILSGCVDLTGANGTESFLLKTNAVGEEVWRYRSQAATYDCLQGLEVIENEEIIVAGWNRQSASTPAIPVLLKLSKDGNLIWKRTYGQIIEGLFYDVAELPDHTFALTGNSSTGSGDSSGIVLKVDRAGNAEWHRYLSGSEFLVGTSAIATDDGGFAVGGSITTGSRSWDFIAVKFDANGNMEWRNEYGTHLEDRASEIIQMPDGGFAIAGLSYGTGDHLAYLVKTDPSGALQWSRNFGHSHFGRNISFGNALTISSKGEIVVAGSAFGEALDFESYIAAFSQDGALQWERRQAGPKGRHLLSIQPTQDGGFVSAGNVFLSNDPSNFSDVLFIKTDSLGYSK